jgi:dTDP-4-dehydrorhamnose reductase
MQQHRKKILVTGANGQLGNELRNIAHQWQQLDFVFTDVNELDITDQQAICSAVNDNAIDLVVNCAAYTAVDKAEGDPDKARLLNADAPGMLARAISARGGEMIHISTDYVFGGDRCKPYTEDCPTGPRSVYGSTKLEGERQVAEGCAKSVILRTAWLYSPYGNNFVKTMLRLGRERESLNVVFDQVGTPTYAHDLAVAIATIAAADQRTYGTFHFSNEGVTSWYDFTKAIHRLAGITSCQVSPIRTEQYPTPAQRPAFSVLDKTKIKQAYNISIPHWEESLKECLARIAQQDKQ